MKTISFYRTASGNCPVKEHLDNLTDVQATKIAWVLKLIREIDQVPSKYFKKLVKTNDIWEARVDVGRNTFRLLVVPTKQCRSIISTSYISQLLAARSVKSGVYKARQGGISKPALLCRDYPSSWLFSWS